ncbi:MAG TPA: TonB-dependent receptor [Longimicrobiaceae bacterium]|nr:TonB-dependent receptor [Longimicrobiaceae bacterium]
MADTARSDSAAAVRLAPIEVNARRMVRLSPVQTQTFPVVSSVTAQRAQETVNVVDTEDAVKYLPSVFLRKRNYGDTQATLATRVWGTSSSARTLVFADGIPLTALIANNNTIGGPRWGLVSPAEVARVDIMYGPFSAAYAGNSMGGVMEITTRLPTRLEGSVSLTQAAQRFSLYGTDDTYGTTQATVHVGDRLGRLAFWTSVSYQESESQPLSYVTNASFPAGTTGGFEASNKLGAPADVVGAGGLLHTRMANARVKLAYDVTPTLQAAYSFGLWRNDAQGHVDSYVTSSSSGQPTFAGLAGFASGNYGLLQQHTAHSLTLRTNLRKAWDFEAVATRYSFGQDRQRTPTTASKTDATFGAPGRVALLDGTGWSTLDGKAIWRVGGPEAAHTLSFGAHVDRYVLENPTYNTTDWTTGEPRTTVATEGDGRTRTAAAWAQDSWQLPRALKLTVGLRYEDWHAYDGLNVNGSSRVEQPAVHASRFSPKATLAWTPANWLVSASAGKAYRFPTTAELYQLVSTGTTFTAPAPDLKPDDDLSIELRAERQFADARLQLSLFQDDVHDAIISQFLPLAPGSATLYSYLSNVDHVRARGVEFVGAVNDLLVPGLELTGNVTYTDARTLALSGRASATAPEGSAVGKRVPNIPDWRATLLTTYRRNERLAVALGARYSAKVYTTLDNADVNPNTYQGFSSWFVMDTHANYRVDRHWSGSLGVDNLLDRKYFLFHPFPQRTLVASLQYGW